jgi:5-methylcytosine-specific restriction protein B
VRLSLVRSTSDRASASRTCKELLTRFPLREWPTISLERYALGQENSEETFCRWMEFRSRKLGGIGGGTSKKHIIFKRKGTGEWYFPKKYRDERDAWNHVRDGFVEAFRQAQAGEWNAIDEIDALKNGPALKLKALHVYFDKDAERASVPRRGLAPRG